MSARKEGERDGRESRYWEQATIHHHRRNVAAITNTTPPNTGISTTIAAAKLRAGILATLPCAPYLLGSFALHLVGGGVGLLLHRARLQD